MKAFPLAGLLALSLIGADLALAQEDATDIVATAVREQGYACEDPETAQPDPQNSSPDEKAWTIRCGSDSYRVKFMGDEGAEVEPLAE